MAHVGQKWLVQGVAPLLAALLVLAGVVALGHWTQGRLREQERSTLPFSAIDCPSPSGLNRAAFLEQVRQRSKLPECLDVYDSRLAEQLAPVFAAHPLVESVEHVVVKPPRQVRVDLVYRTPVLAIARGQQVWVVDGQGVLLPAEAQGLPVLLGSRATPPVEVGLRWDDEGVQAVAHTAAFLARQQEHLHLTTAEWTEHGVILSTAIGSRVYWGHAPGKETAGEPSAARKLERLLHHFRVHGDLDHPDGPCEHDVRREEKTSSAP